MPDLNQPIERWYAVIKLTDVTAKDAYFRVFDFAKSRPGAREKALVVPGAMVFPRPFQTEPEPGEIHRFPIGLGAEFREFDRAARRIRDLGRDQKLS